MLGSLALSNASTLFIPLAFGPVPVAAGMPAMAQSFDGTGMAYKINKVSPTQAITPSRLLSRVNAGMQVSEQLARLLGLLVGGALGQLVGCARRSWWECRG